MKKWNDKEMLIEFITLDGKFEKIDTNKLYGTAVFTQKPPTRKKYAEMQLNLLKEKFKAGMIKGYKVIE